MGIYVGRNDDSDCLKVRLENGRIVNVSRISYDNRRYEYNRKDQSINDKIIGSMECYPIKLGYAITIHKSQGMTFDNMIFDSGNGMFAHGQLYVALSRVRSMSGLRLIKPIKSKDIIIDPCVRKFIDNTKFDIPVHG
jgi:ATP-dependent exoDNAse (exonuclease V) alpha subunit